MSRQCDYGCGQKATHQFKNGKWCCTKQKWKEDNKLGSKEHLKKISEASKNNWKQNKTIYSKAIKDSWKNNEEQKKKISDRNKELWKNGIFSTKEYREKLKKGTKKGWENNIHRKNILSKKIKKSWENPTEKMLDGKKKAKKKIKEYWAKQENRDRQKKKQKEIWKDPILRKQAKLRSMKNYNDPDYIEKLRKGINQKPNKKETNLLEILNELFPNEYIFVGDFKLWIDGKNPDFICYNKNKLIEHFGDYWHSEELIGKPEYLHEEERKNHFLKHGYDCLIIWESELNNIDQLKKKIKEFHLCQD